MNTCLQCGKSTKNPKFCNQSCAASYNNQGKRRHGNAGGNCLECGNKKPSVKYKFCGKSCYLLHKKNLNKSKVSEGFIVGWRSIRKYLLETVGKCQECGIFKWNNKPISLECDHIDGDRSNNTLENAKLLCPNCHSQTSTYRIKNRDNPKGKKVREKRYRKMELPGGIEPHAFHPTLRISLED